MRLRSRTNVSILQHEMRGWEEWILLQSPHNVLVRSLAEGFRAFWWTVVPGAVPAGFATTRAGGFWGGFCSAISLYYPFDYGLIKLSHVPLAFPAGFGSIFAFSPVPLSFGSFDIKPQTTKYTTTKTPKRDKFKRISNSEVSKPILSFSYVFLFAMYVILVW